MDAWIVLALAAAAGVAVALAPAWGAAATIAAALVVRRSGTSGRAIVIAVALLALGAMRSRARLEAARDTYAHAVAALTPPSRCEATGVVASSPVVESRAGQGPPDDARIDVRVLEGACADRRVPRDLRVRLHGAPEDLARGDRVDLVFDVAPVHLFANETAASPYAAIARSGIVGSGGVVTATVVAREASLANLIDRARASVRRRIAATFHPLAVPLARALVLGESDLDDADDEAFRASGLAHLLAVSGTHLVLAVLGLGAMLRALLVRVRVLAARIDVGRLVAAILVPLAWIYADFAGGSGSAVRAAAMVTAAMTARALGRKPAPKRAFALSLLGCALVDPLALADVSFALSAAATAGLIALGPGLNAALARGPKPVRKLLGAVATTLAATIPCAPLLAALAPGLPALSVAANIVAAPIGELAALPVCLAHALVAFAPPIERGAAIVGSGALLAVRSVARASAAAGMAIPVPPPTVPELAILAVGALAIAALRERRERIAAGAALAVGLVVAEVAAMRAGAPRGELRVTHLDVGQGDSAIVDLPDGRMMVIDGGGFVGSPVDPGLRVLLPVLRARRRRRVDVVVLSHPHPDHFTGLASALPTLDVGELWDSGQGEDQGAGSTYAGMIAGLRARRVPIRRPRELCGPPRDLGGATVEVLAPCPTYEPDRGANDNSLVLRIRFGARAVLFVGDAEHEEEADLLAAHRDALRADLLKVGHHGSRTSTSPAFLAAVAPTLAVISSGVRNRFGHPYPTTLATLAAAGVRTLRTDRGGAVVWSTDGRGMRVERPGDAALRPETW